MLKNLVSKKSKVNKFNQVNILMICIALSLHAPKSNDDVTSGQPTTELLANTYLDYLRGGIIDKEDGVVKYYLDEAKKNKTLKNILEEVDKDGETPLHLAIQTGSRKSIIKMLLEYAQEAGVLSKLLVKKDKLQKTPLQIVEDKISYAIDKKEVKQEDINRLEEIRKLLNNDAKAKASSSSSVVAAGSSALRRKVVRYEDPYSIGLFLNFVDDKNKPQKEALKDALEEVYEDDITPLHLAANTGCFLTIKTLLEYAQEAGVLSDLLFKEDREQKTPLYLAAKKGCFSTIQMLLQYAQKANVLRDLLFKEDKEQKTHLQMVRDKISCAEKEEKIKPEDRKKLEEIENLLKDAEKELDEVLNCLTNTFPSQAPKSNSDKDISRNYVAASSSAIVVSSSSPNAEPPYSSVEPNIAKPNKLNLINAITCFDLCAINGCLSLALESGSNCLKNLLEPGIEEGVFYAPLHEAVRNNNKVVEHLLGWIWNTQCKESVLGGVLESVDNDGRAPLHLAVYQNSHEIIYVIIQYANLLGILSNVLTNKDFDDKKPLDILLSRLKKEKEVAGKRSVLVETANLLWSYGNSFYTDEERAALYNYLNYTPPLQAPESNMATELSSSARSIKEELAYLRKHDKTHLINAIKRQDLGVINDYLSLAEKAGLDRLEDLLNPKKEDGVCYDPLGEAIKMSSDEVAECLLSWRDKIVDKARLNLINAIKRQDLCTINDCLSLAQKAGLDRLRELLSPKKEKWGCYDPLGEARKTHRNEVIECLLWWIAETMVL